MAGLRARERSKNGENIVRRPTALDARPDDVAAVARAFRFLCGELAFDAALMRAAIGATFERRKTAIPTEPPLALTEAFAADEQQQTQWKAFLNRSRVADKALTLSEVVRVMSAFLMPALEALRRGEGAVETWPPGGPWRASS
jgi:hypothetical protein